MTRFMDSENISRNMILNGRHQDLADCVSHSWENLGLDGTLHDHTGHFGNRNDNFSATKARIGSTKSG
jgi:hypothetical protein